MAPKKGIRFFTFSNLICFRITESRPKKTDRYRRSLSDVHHVSGAKTQTQIDWHNGTRTQVPIGNPYRFFFMKEGASAPEREFRLASLSGIYMHTIRPLCLNGKLVRELEIFRTIGK